MTALARVRLSQSPAAIAKAMHALDEMEENLHSGKAETFEDVQKIRRLSQVLTALFRDYKNVSDRAGEVNTVAHVIIGRKLGELPRAKGAQTIGRNKTVRPMDDAPSYAEIGISSRTQASRFRRMAEIPEAERNAAAIAALKADPERHVTPTAVLREVIRSTKDAHVQVMRTRAGVFSEDGPFATMVIDPPWPEKWGTSELAPQTAADYPTLSLEDIRKECAKLRQRAEPDCHIFLWSTQRLLPTAFSILEEEEGLGARYGGFTMVWHKISGGQPTGYPKYNCEFVLYGKIGSPVFIDTKAFFTCFNAPSREHSRKPDEFYDVIRRVTAGPRLDAFSREQREGFAQYGNEIDKFDAVPMAEAAE